MTIINGFLTDFDFDTKMEIKMLFPKYSDETRIIFIETDIFELAYYPIGKELFELKPLNLHPNIKVAYSETKDILVYNLENPNE